MNNDGLKIIKNLCVSVCIGMPFHIYSPSPKIILVGEERGVGRAGKWGGGGGERSLLTLHSHHHNDSCTKMDRDDGKLNVS